MARDLCCVVIIIIKSNLNLSVMICFLLFLLSVCVISEGANNIL